ncbi:putative toxin-antitoxin system toxin component, PIN family [candidate division WOR-1 bacterium RIFOXYD2_FULL_36_8]|uniref:Putative toxin-antitoxin system toxin component, PIN family n=1 Tax=candidate division WOR-1 bacterium RIFOXYB2_FULL_36_35 TaxID=1802578 RepID=A0A1F4S6W2_UNCSA|nr:MAG: putative toxin-antitoxin system toxin component, PIN family [candidate division WOR-1 bacterium RIFOXYA2_FULL_36_21]OGC14504.1 MAG: putative toxin-antitoxin system toxin component, PIN family [candidate division WOR-1 bacterium RIFOXYA12_FULL_36_13]OGC15483.1 MAG: putative toxin-antitoxin system toxin component, PIN family [candidate division WOR-1 bacterium RIFOXYB2_FULL_36_35]OGC38286.1 MAG: putative toxin-antitoxin system toxin component, PIN family [candidate division WOR-1 bacterium
MTLEKNKLTVVLDTNVFISALIFGGIPFELFDLCRQGRINLVVSSHILLEFARILQTKFKFSKKMALDVVSEIRRISKIVYPNIKIDIVKQDLSDNKIIECAVEGGAGYLVSGDSHLLDIKYYKTIKIVSLSEFLKFI